MKLRYEVGDRVRFRSVGLAFFEEETGTVDRVHRRMLTVNVDGGDCVDCTAEDVEPEDAE